MSVAFRPEELVGCEIAGLRLVSFVKAGGMAWVYRGENVLNTGIVRAVKVLRPDLAADEEFRRRFAREAEAIERLRHPGVVGFFGLRADKGYLVMEQEMLDGSDLDALRLQRWPIDTVVGWIREAAEGVGAAHALSPPICHRDLKPSNLFLTREGRIKVLDFGLARARSTGGSGTSVAVGTVAYMAPEVVQGGGGNAVPASDVYALGITAWEICAGRHPFADKIAASEWAVMSAHVNDAVPSLRSVRPDVPEWLDAVIARCVEKDPERRYADGAALARELAAPAPVRAPRPVPPPPPSPIPKVAAVAAASGGALLLAAGAGAAALVAFLLWLGLRGDAAPDRPAPAAIAAPTAAPSATMQEMMATAKAKADRADCEKAERAGSWAAWREYYEAWPTGECAARAYGKVGLVVPRRQFGPVRATTTSADLRRDFGANAVRFIDGGLFYVGATGEQSGYLVNVGGGWTLEVIGLDDNSSGDDSLAVCSESGQFQVEVGVAAGAPLSAVSKVMGRFDVTGFTNPERPRSTGSVGGIDFELRPKNNAFFANGRNSDLLGNYEMGPSWEPGRYASDDATFKRAEAIVARMCIVLKE